MTPVPPPPRWLEALQRQLIPGPLRDEVMGDFREEWESRRSAGESSLSLTMEALRHTVGIALTYRVAHRGGGSRGHRLRTAVRQLLRAPGLTATVVTALALGVAGNTAILALADAVLLEPLPFPAAARLGMVSYDFSGSETDGFGLAWRDVEALRESTPSIEAVAGVLDWQHVDLTDGNEPVRVPASFVAPGYLELLGVGAVEGRIFTEAENTGSDAAAVALLGRALWRDAFGADPSVVGRPIHLNGRPHTVVGILPEERSDLRQRLGDRAGVVLPLLAAETLLGLELREARGPGPLNALVRLRPEAGWERARDELGRVSAELARTHPDSNEGWSFDLEPLSQVFHGELRAPVGVLAGGAALVFLLVAFNLGSLMAIRGVDRRREAAVRLAMGARGRTLVQLVVQETLILTAVGGGIGLVGGVILVDLVRTSGWLDLPSFTIVEPSLRVLGLSVLFLLALATFLTAVGSLPLLRSGLDGLRDGTRGTGGRGVKRLRSVLVGGEVALAFTLLVGAGLMVRSLDTLRGTGYGFDTDDLVTLRLELRGPRWDSDDARRAAARELVDGGRSIPHVREAFLWSPNTIGQGSWVDLVTREDRWDLNPRERIEASRHHLLPGGFERAGLDLVRGRGFSDADGAADPAVAVVSESLGEALWPGEDPIGQRFESRAGGELRVREVVGVAEDARHRSRLVDPFGPQLDVYYAYAQWPQARLSLGVRTTPGADLESVAADVRRVAREIDPTLPVFELESLDDRMRREESRARVTTVLILTYALLAGVLAAVGIYGVLARSVRDRTREIGVRMALGADRGTVAREVALSGAVPLALGALAGAGLALAAGRIASTVLYGVSPRDPIAFALAAVALALIAAVAVAGPTLRASRVRPGPALTAE